MKRYAGVIIGVVAAALFIRLGVWQLSRRAERLAQNAVLEARLALPSLDLTGGAPAMSAEPDSLRFRRVRARGRFDFSHELVEAGRSFQGAPGVHVLTPLLLSDGVGVLVDRGWVYSADGRTVELGALREPDSAEVEGVLGLPVGRWSVRPDTLRPGYILVPAVLRRTVAAPDAPAALRPVPLPVLDAGPHLSYALQWFSFAAIALVGGTLLTRRDLRRRAG
jgi:surfeit locus 1 family protein